MKRTHLPIRALSAFLALSPLTLGTVSCVPYTTYEQVKNDRDKFKGAYDALTQKYNRSIQDILKLQKEGATNEVMQEKLATLENLNKELNARLARVDQIAPIAKNELPPELTAIGGEQEGNGIRLSEEVLFNAGEATLSKPNAKRALDLVLDLLQKNHPGQVIHITGHTDSDPLTHTRVRWGDNQFLGYNRAYTVFKYFKDKGVREDAMVCHSMGPMVPIRDKDQKELKAQSRRVVIHVGAVKF